MAKNKRQLDGDEPLGLDNVHASRKKRVKYTEQDANLAEIYNNLADEVESTRIKAAGDLLKTLSAASLEDPERLHQAETRLIKGLCSGRKAARLGFSIALTELFRLKFSSKPGSGVEEPSLESTVDTIVKLTKPQGNLSAQEKRDHFLGQRFSFQALLQSDVGLQQKIADDQWKYLLQSIFKLASEKQWLRRECGAMIHEYLTSSATSKLSDVKICMVIDELVAANLTKTPEGVGIWLTVQESSPQVKLPKHVWHHRDPLSSKDLPILAKVLLELSSNDATANVKNGSRQSTISFAWKVVLSQVYQLGDKRFSKFWEAAVASTMFGSSASTERVALGLQVLSLAIGTAPKALLPVVLGARGVLGCIFKARSSAERHLFEAAKIPLDHMVARSAREPDVASTLIQVFSSIGRINIDQVTKSKTLEQLIRAADANGLVEIVQCISKEIMRRPLFDEKQAENERRELAGLLLTTLRAHRQPDELFYQDPDWPESSLLCAWTTLLIQNMVSFGFGRPVDGIDAEFSPSISETTQAMIRARLISCLGELITFTINQAVLAPALVVDSLSKITDLQTNLSSTDRRAVEAATQYINEIRLQRPPTIAAQSFQLLFSLSIIQVFSQEPDGGEALADLISCYQTLESSNDSMTTLIELLLSFISKPSALYKKLAQQVFPVYASQITPEALQSLVDILGQRESLSGQQALFDQQDADGAEEAESAADDAAGLDIEDASDVELVNGDEAGDPDAEDGSLSLSSSSDAEEGAETAQDEEDEAAAFDKKLAEALGTAGLEDSDDDGSDMDDDQMMALEPHLASIFKERQKVPNKKSDRKDAKENIVNFKNRVLDLLTIYVKSQYHNVFALDLLLPLTELIRTTTSKPAAEKAFAVLKQYFESCSKHKELPWPPDHEPCFQLLMAVHAEMKLGGSKLHANACSRASLFLCKVLVGRDPEHYKRIADEYAKLQAEWYLDEKSRVPSSVFTEWTSWSISTRKHA